MAEGLLTVEASLVADPHSQTGVTQAGNSHPSGTFSVRDIFPLTAMN
jgi:hypothetical protein